jgi:hypothetical protein
MARMAAAACSGDAGEDSGGAGLLARRAQVATAPGSSVDVIAVIFESFVASVQHAGLEDGGARDLGRILLGLVPLAACGSLRPRQREDSSSDSDRSHPRRRCLAARQKIHFGRITLAMGGHNASRRRRSLAWRMME